MTLWSEYGYNMVIMIEKVNTAKLKEQLCHYLGLARQGKEVLITSHQRIVARLLGEDVFTARLLIKEPTKPLSALKDVGGFGFKTDPLHDILKERNKR